MQQAVAAEITDALREPRLNGQSWVLTSIALLREFIKASIHLRIRPRRDNQCTEQLPGLIGTSSTPNVQTAPPSLEDRLELTNQVFGFFFDFDFESRITRKEPLTFHDNPTACR